MVRFQVADVPKVQPEVTEYQQYSIVCPDPECQTETVEPLPPEAEAGVFGPRAVATVGLLTGAYRLSKRMAQKAMKDLFGFDMSLGSVAACEQMVSNSIEAPVEEAQAFIRTQPIKNADETSWYHGIKRAKAYLWVACTPWVVVFLVQTSRSAEAARQLLGKVFGVLVTDRYKGYDWWPLEQRQLCWAHLKRDIQAMIDAGRGAKRIGRALEKLRRKLFTWWHRARDGTMTRYELQARVAVLRRQVHRLLDYGTCCGHKPTEGTCRDLLRLEPAMWTFVHREGVEPTNNFGERSIRHAVLWRKISFGTHSDAGARYVERVLTVHATLRLQTRNVLDYLMESVTAAIHGAAPPSLLPAEMSTMTTLP